MARSLLLGGAGFIGLHLARRLLADAGAQVTIVDDFSRGRHDDELEAVAARPGVELVTADLTDADSLRALPRAWDEVYLLAAVVGVRPVMADPARVIRVNTLATLVALDWIEPPARVFFASTSEVYAGGVERGIVPVPTPESVPLAIEDVEHPRFAYAASKILGEAAAIHYGAARKLPCVIGRFHNVYGPRMGTDHVIPELCLRALGGEDPFRVYGAEQRRAFCHVGDAIDAIVALVRHPAAWSGIVNIGNDREETAIADLAALVLETAGRRPVIRREPAPGGSVSRRCPDLQRLRELTGVSPRISLRDGVRETFEWYRAQHQRQPMPGGAPA